MAPSRQPCLPAYLALWALLLQLPGDASDGASCAGPNHHHVDLACRSGKREACGNSAQSPAQSPLYTGPCADAELLSHVPQLLEPQAEVMLAAKVWSCEEAQMILQDLSTTDPASVQRAGGDLQVSHWSPRFLHLWHLLA